MNRQTLITAIASVIAFILLVINTIAGTNFSMSEDVITSVATLLSVAVMWFISNYWNQDYTRTARKFTKSMRIAKKLAKKGDATLEDLIEAITEEAAKYDD